MGFAEDLKKICDRAGDKAELVVRRAALELYGQMIERSPVGNPDLWKSPAPSGYVGGRFKNNWQVGIGSIDTRTNRGVDDSGSGAITSGNAALKAWTPGKTIFLSNSMPYAYRLEYEGWSKQSPSGMVRLSVQNFEQAVAKAAKGLK